MPLYEYYCRVCDSRFEQLRPMGAAGEPAVCPAGHEGAMRVLSLFTAASKGERGETAVVPGGCACGGACTCGSFA